MNRFSGKFTEKLKLLGDISERSDDNFYLIFKPPINKAVNVFIKNDSVFLQSLYIEEYTPLVMWSDPAKRYENLTEKEALKIIISLRDNLGWIEN